MIGFSMERVNLEMLKIYGNNKHEHKLYRIISWVFFLSFGIMSI